MVAVSTVSLLALGGVGVLGYSVGHPAPVQSGLTKEEIAEYRLTTFPLSRAVAFADRYARLCLNQDPEQVEQRQDAIARLSSSGVDTSCGWDGKGAQVVAYSVWSGYAEPVTQYKHHAFYIGIQATLTTGAIRTLSVPVYVADLKTGDGMRVVGDVGTLPQPEQATPPEAKDRSVQDSQLSTDLQDKLFQDFFAAWGASNSDNLSRYVSPEATKTARLGLRGALQDPKVTDVEVLLPDGVTAGQSHSWKAGDATWAWVAVRWTTGETAHMTEHYRVQIVLTDQGWFVKDIRAGVPDESGGKAIP
ncbi:conjugal transfer protein [Streptomyces sp. NPDC051572]|jgi:hypothetical protein|uniref:conjugal transfer protein n=1 Tax=Streptomyces sp. NPDC051572 TaxID=3155802 RepID=UPI003450C019